MSNVICLGDEVKKIKFDIIQNNLLEEMSPIEVYESLVDEVDLSLFGNNKTVFLRFIESVIFDVVVAEFVYRKNGVSFEDFYEH